MRSSTAVSKTQPILAAELMAQYMQSMYVVLVTLTKPESTQTDQVYETMRTNELRAYLANGGPSKGSKQDRFVGSLDYQAYMSAALEEAHSTLHVDTHTRLGSEMRGQCVLYTHFSFPPASFLKTTAYKPPLFCIYWDAPQDTWQVSKKYHAEWKVEQSGFRKLQTYAWRRSHLQTLTHC